MTRNPSRLVLATAVVVLSLVGAFAAFNTGSEAPGGVAIAHPRATGSPDGPGGDWRLAFSDHFAGTTLDAAHWSTCYYWDCTNRSQPELEWYEASQATVENGTLSLTADPEQTHGKQYVSGMVSSYGKFSFTYGYAQVVAKLPSGQGLWSAFWTLPEAGGWPPEIDIMENWAQSDTIDLFLHYGQSGWEQSSVVVPTFSDGFHTYGVDWEPGSISWYVDGALQAHFAVSITEPEYLLASLAVAGNPGPDPSVRFPQSLQIRSIEVWQHPRAADSHATS
ncbi:MAG: family 16 glycosylhydrolase [Acidimicrobiales bacterium]|jgi:beta-glucanase (GH16 family)